MNETAQVAVIHATMYDKCSEYIERIFELLQVNYNLSGKRVLLKPNLRSGNTPEKAVNTHPEFLRAVIRFFKKQNAHVLVGDSCGVYGFTQICFETSGMAAVIREEGAELLNFDRCRIGRYPVSGAVLKEIFLPIDLENIDLFVTLPKLKTHSYLELTGALKNQIGCLPGGVKARLHYTFSTRRSFCDAILDLNEYLKPRLAIIDGITCMEGNGPARGTPRATHVILAGTQLPVVDTVACKLLGLNPKLNPILQTAQHRGHLSPNPSIQILGDSMVSLSAAVQKAQMKKSEAIEWIYRLRNKQKERAVRLQIHVSRCTQCKICEQLCPVNAIKLSPHPVIDERKCIYCYSCYENCPTQTYALKMSYLVKRMIQKQIDGYVI